MQTTSTNDITVALLIYKSPAYLDFVMNSLIDAEQYIKPYYLIVCNDATQEVIEAAQEWSYHPRVSYVVHQNIPKDPYWIQNVYGGWNRCWQECKTSQICFVNSDMYFSKGWLDNLCKYNLDKFVPTSRLIESERMPSLAGLISKNFGQTIGEFDRNGFNKFAGEVAEAKTSLGVGAFMPSLHTVDNLKKIGGWHKNIGNYPGDKITFGRYKDMLGITNVMVHDSIAYHLQRGESFETGDF